METLIQASLQLIGFAFSSGILYLSYTFLSQIDGIAHLFPGGYKKYFKMRKSTEKFEDVIGQELIKEDLKRALNNETKVKGFIFVGPPGSGKTMLARACATYAPSKTFAEVYCDHISDDVVLGTINYLILNYAKNDGLIIYIDECSSIISKFTNYFLRKLDGFEPLEKVIFICSTNQSFTDSKIGNPLIRSGRFKHYTFKLPDEALRRAWFEKNRPNDKEHISKLLSNSEGLSYADLSTVGINLSATSILTSQIGFDAEKTQLSEKNRRRIAYHELGHFLISLIVKNHETCLLCSIEASHTIGGVNIFKQQEIYTLEELEAKIMICFGGTVAEKYITGSKSTLAQGDIEMIKNIRDTIIKNRMIKGLGELNLSLIKETSPPSHKERLVYLDFLEEQTYQGIKLLRKETIEKLTDLLLQKKVISLVDIPEEILQLKDTFVPNEILGSISL